MSKEIDVGHGLFAIVDDEDYGFLIQHKWHGHKQHGLVYARRTFYRDGKYGSLLMHRVILNPPADMVVDHINGNPLDNRKCNLRVCTNAENMLNRSPRKGGSSRYRGVYWHEKDKRWTATITKSGKRKRIGGFTDEIEAARAYDKAALEIHGEFARLNFLTGCDEDVRHIG